ncbi:MAG TPA: alpha/beta fold hydrolase [Bryobacteraceae bacterium]|nr:alpha/beta fold hydrolase [Bryobacteraceae bacterium]
MTSAQCPAGRWVSRPAPKTDPRVRLFCFHHAGGASDLFSSWTKELDPSIEVALIQLPGRGSRFREPAITSMDAVIQQLAGALTPLLEHPFAFFGHSMGGLIAFELARLLERRQINLGHLFLSGCPAPQARTNRRVSTMNDQQLVAFLSAMNGTPPDVLEHPELRDLIVPLVRADFHLVETYSFKPGARLRAPVSLLLGSNDPETGPADVGLWSELTEAPCNMRQFDGDHFFVKANPGAVTAWISATLLRLPAVAP